MSCRTDRRRLPADGIRQDDVLQQLGERQTGDWPWQEGRSFSLVYHAGPEHDALLRSAYGLYLNGNGLSSRGFPSLATLESEVVSITADLLSGDPDVVAGTMSSGGTESTILAMKSYRDRARARDGRTGRLEIVVPRSAHPAFLKAAAYLDLVPIVVDCGEDFRASPTAMAAAISAATIVLVGSAPSFPQGVVDPIEALAEIAMARGLGLHVDASLGGYVLPFAERLGVPVPAWDFRVPGVTSISTDLHKFGYAAKGASVILYRGADLRRHQFFATDQWSGGVFASPSILGTRPGGAIAAAWAAVHTLGESGYRRLVGQTLDTTSQLLDGIRGLGLQVFGDPVMSVFAFGSTDGPPVQTIADRMEERGWRLDRLQRPDSIHLIITAAHHAIVPSFLADLAASVEAARRDPGDEPAETGPAVLYGVTGDIAAGGDPVASAIAGLERRWQ